MTTEKIVYILKEIRKAEKKVMKAFNYLYNGQSNYKDNNLNININRLSEIDEILSNLEIDLKIILENREENKDE